MVWDALRISPINMGAGTISHAPLQSPTNPRHSSVGTSEHPSSDRTSEQQLVALDLNGHKQREESQRLVARSEAQGRG